ncbi:MAG: glycosyltransferase [Flaviramulus sp.]|nr:galactosyltransferase-related protein [Flaviramulus sp.]NNC50936.1 glycosyltransferase [Flaviramulus sp.]
MITIVLTNRNRDLDLVKCCLASFDTQTNNNFKIILVDYGSRESNLKDLKVLVSQYPSIKFISCETSKQLWCKSRAINIVLKQCKTSYFFVGDIDMIYHPECIEKLHQLKSKADAIYFQVGFLSEGESRKNKQFNDYELNFKSTGEATGITLFKTKILQSINGYDEFYHGWGSEDTDVHVRLINAKKSLFYYDKAILMLHQWHPKTYRSKKSTEPYHSFLEKINQKYLAFTKESGKTKANNKFEWGHYDFDSYRFLENIDVEYNVTNELSDVKGFIYNVLLSVSDKVISVTVKNHKEYNTLKHHLKNTLNKKVKTFLDLQDVNNTLLETIITNCRNAPYDYVFDKHANQISLIIKL